MRFVLTGVILFVSVAVGACARQTSSATKSESETSRFPELAVKQTLQTSAKPSSNLQLRAPGRSISTTNGEKFVLPVSASFTESNDLYIADNNAHKILRWPADSATAEVVSTDTGKSELKFPGPIQYAQNKLYVSDNDGIKVYLRDGKFERLIRSFIGIFFFTVTDKQTFLVSPIIRNPEPEDPLLVELDMNGKQLRTFGHRTNGHNGMDDQAYLALSGKSVYVAYKYRPLVEIYSFDSGSLVNSFNVNHPVFSTLEKDLQARVGSEKQQQGRVYVPRYLAGIKVLNGRIFICLHLPQPEIWEMNEKGDLRQAYRITNLTPAVEVFGFDLRPNGENLNFSLGIIDPKWNATVCQLNLN